MTSSKPCAGTSTRRKSASSRRATSPRPQPSNLWGGPPGPRGSPWTRSVLEKSNACHARTSGQGAGCGPGSRTRGSAPQAARWPQRPAPCVSLGLAGPPVEPDGTECDCSPSRDRQGAPGRAVRRSDLKIPKIRNADLHHFQVHFHEVILDPARFGRGKDLLPVQAALAHGHFLFLFRVPVLHVHGNEAAGVFRE